MNSFTGIVVGVDGSEESLNAFEFALDQARDRSEPVHVMTAYQSPRYWALPGGMPLSVTEEEIAQGVQEQTQSLIDERLAKAPSAPKVELTVVAGPAAKVLIDASQEADMLVVGHRGRSGFAQTVLGSVALQCVLHARCSVIIVRSNTRSRPRAADQLATRGAE
jgi:nucleotide-binding universal stress UspA family protein